MKFIKPVNRAKVEWKISKRTRRIIEGYAKYTELSEDDVVDIFLQKNILEDQSFLRWLLNKRNNKRLIDDIFPDGLPQLTEENENEKDEEAVNQK
jgi:phospholipase C